MATLSLWFQESRRTTAVDWGADRATAQLPHLHLLFAQMVTIRVPPVLTVSVLDFQWAFLSGWHMLFTQ